MYRKEVRKTSKETCRTFCSSITDLPRSARLHRALSRDPKVRLASLVAPSRGCTQSEVEKSDLLYTHFLNAEALEGEWHVLLPAVLNDWIGGWRQRLSPMGNLYGQLINLLLTKVQELMGYPRPSYKRNESSLSLNWSEYFMPAWRLAMFQQRGASLR
jgi:hypothetical protein